MNSFVISQAESFGGGKITVQVGFTEYKAFDYTHKTNHPVNMSMVLTYYAETLTVAGESDKVVYPAIVFKGSDGRGIAQWLYPPSSNGKAMRDADLNHIHTTFAQRCPKDNPNTIR